MGMEHSTNGENKNACRILVGKPEQRRPFGRPRCMCVDLREIGGCGMDWIDLAQNRDKWRVLVNTVMNLRVPQHFFKILEQLHNWQFLKKG
jgi:hypothetical protein